jgi:cytoskeletal protein RodZ
MDTQNTTDNTIDPENQKKKNKKPPTWVIFVGMALFLLLVWIIYAIFSSINPNRLANPNANESALSASSASTTLLYGVESPSVKQSDGKYRTLFEIFIYYPLGTQPKAMNVSKILDCPPMSSSDNTTYSQNPNGIRFSISCLSDAPIPQNETSLFQI